MTRLNRSLCPISVALDIIGDRWTLLILRDVLGFKKKFYEEFLDSPERIATNILSDRLAKLEASGMLTKSVDPENRRRNIYLPTAKAIEILPTLFEMLKWSTKYNFDEGLDETYQDFVEEKVATAIEEARRILSSAQVDSATTSEKIQ